MNINEYLKHAYLTPGSTRDNFLFEGCSLEFLSCAKTLLSNNTDTISCTIEIDSNLEQLLEKAYSCFDSDMHKRIISRDYLCLIIMKSLLSSTNGDIAIINDLNYGLQAFHEGNGEIIKLFHTVAPMPYEITNFYKSRHKFELNFILTNTKNKYLQEAINNFISAREPFSVKVFSNGTLPTYIDQMGNFLQSPHDYMQKDFSQFIEPSVQPSEKE